MISIIIPFYNEKENIPILLKEIEHVFENKDYEVLLVNDGSKDNYELKIKNEELKKIQLIKLNIRYGKGEALRRGLERAKGDIIIFMDGDLQDDPKDAVHLIEKLNEGYDLVNGVRIKRKENVLVKLYSFIVNEVVLKKVLHSPFSDINCGLKVFRNKVLQSVSFYGNSFRFFPLAVYYAGYRVAEVTITNRDRKYGKSKFGWKKLVIGLYDTVAALFLFRFAEKPLHFFGTVGGIVFGTGFILAIYLSIERLFFNVQLYRRPALWLAISLIIVGIQIVMTGIIGELIVYQTKKNITQDIRN